MQTSRFHPPPLSAVILMALAMFCVASNDAMGKHLSQSYSVWQILWLRSWVWLAFALVWVASRCGIREALRSTRPVLQLFRSALLVAEVLVFIIALRLLPLGDVSAVAAATPLVVLVCAVLFLGERVGPHRWMAVFIGMVGMLAVSRPGAGAFGWLTLLPIVGVLMWGIYQVLLRLVSRTDRVETTLLWTGLALFVVTGCVAPWVWITPPDLTTWLVFLGVGLFNTAGHFALMLAMERAEVSSLQPFSYTAVLWAMLFGWAFFDEIPDMWTVCGATLIIAGGLYAVHRERVRSVPAAATER